MFEEFSPGQAVFVKWVWWEGHFLVIQDLEEEETLLPTLLGKELLEQGM